MKLIKTAPILALMCFSLGCKYEKAQDTTPVSANQTADNKSENSQIANETKQNTLISIAKCEGECSCDELTTGFNDTGVTFAGDFPTTNLPLCDNQAGFSQDCTIGRDSQTNLLKQGSGQAGFDFTKLDPQGQVLPADASEWQCVLDHTSGLIWEVKSAANSGLMQDSAFSYSWRDDNQPDYSTADKGNCDSDCDTQSYLMQLNESKLCGFDDWRLPNKIELQDLVHYGQTQPSIDTQFFPHTQPSFYWSSSIDTDDTNSVWSVDFNSGRVAGGLSSEPQKIRAVRGNHTLYNSQSLVSDIEATISNRQQLAPLQRCSSKVPFSSPAERYLQDDQGNILDKHTGLIWQRCAAGLSGEQCEQGEAQRLNWQQAFEYVTTLNDTTTGAKWRLPSIKELQANNELACEEPALNPFVFPNVPMGQVWSSTPHNRLDDSSYQYEYRNSIIFYSNRTTQHFVHAVKNCRVQSQ